MKKRDIILVSVSVVVLVIVGALLYRYIAPPTKNSGIKYTVPHPVNPNFDTKQIVELKTKTDYSQNISPQASLFEQQTLSLLSNLKQIISRN